MAVALIAIPLIAAALAAAIPSNRWRPWVLPPAAIAHFVCSIYSMSARTPGELTRWLALDPPGRLVLLIISILFLVCAFYTVGYLHQRAELSNRVFCACLLLFLATSSLVICSMHLGLMWVAI